MLALSRGSPCELPCCQLQDWTFQLRFKEDVIREEASLVWLMDAQHALQAAGNYLGCVCRAVSVYGNGEMGWT